MDVNLIYEKEFETLLDYKVDDVPSFYINSTFDEFNINLNEPSTSANDVYDDDIPWGSFH